VTPRRSSRKGTGVPTPAEVRRWPVTVDVVTAGRCYGLGRDGAYRRAATGELAPGVPVLRLGRRLVVTRAHLMAALGITDPAPTPPADPGNAHAPGAELLVTIVSGHTRSDATGPIRLDPGPDRKVASAAFREVP
jgi:hypothetical protein